MHTQLVSSPGAGCQPDKAEPLTTAKNFVICNSNTARITHGDLLPVTGMAREGFFNTPSIFFKLTSHGCDVDASNGMILELSGQAAMCGVVLGRYYDPGGAFIQPVNDPRSHNPAYPGQVLAMVQQSVDEGACIMALSRVYYHVRGLIDDDKIRILVQNC